MGTTVTPNLALIKPDLDESIKEALPTFPGWAAQKGINMDKIDALFRHSTSTWVLNWTADGGNPTLGSGGFTEGKFVRLFPRLVLGFFRIQTGTTGFLTGTGVYRLNLPTAVAPEFDIVDDGIPIGKANFFDTSASATSDNFLCTYNPNSGNMYLTPPVGGAWSSTTPVVPAQGDRVAGFFMYPTADA